MRVPSATLQDVHGKARPRSGAVGLRVRWRRHTLVAGCGVGLSARGWSCQPGSAVAAPHRVCVGLTLRTEPLPLPRVSFLSPNSLEPLAAAAAQCSR